MVVMRRRKTVSALLNYDDEGGRKRGLGFSNTTRN